MPSNRNSHIPGARSPTEVNFVLWTFGKFVLPFEFQCVDCSLNEGNGSYLESQNLYRIVTDNFFTIYHKLRSQPVLPSCWYSVCVCVCVNRSH